jgi:hypothetical protein
VPFPADVLLGTMWLSPSESSELIISQESGVGGLRGSLAFLIEFPSCECVGWIIFSVVDLLATAAQESEPLVFSSL